MLARDGRRVTATIVGDGPDRPAFEARRAKSSASAIRFVGAMPARAAFALGRLLVVPSRAESLPYIVLEAAAAGLPLIATDVGGIPEIFGPDAAALVRPDDPAALAQAIGAALRNPTRRDADAAPAGAGARRVLRRRHDRRRACRLWRSASTATWLRNRRICACRLSIS